MTDADELARGLSGPMRRGILWLPKEGYVVGGFRGMGGQEPSQYAQRRLRELGLIEEHWTWASTTRPDTGLSPLGLAVRTHLEQSYD